MDLVFLALFNGPIKILHVIFTHISVLLIAPRSTITHHLHRGSWRTSRLLLLPLSSSPSLNTCVMSRRPIHSNRTAKTSSLTSGDKPSCKSRHPYSAIFRDSLLCSYHKIAMSSSYKTNLLTSTPWKQNCLAATESQMNSLMSSATF